MAYDTDPYSGMQTPQNGQGVNPPADWVKFKDSARARMLGDFPNTAARDAAAAPLIALGAEWLIAGVDGIGFTGYNADSNSWVTDLSPRIYYEQVRNFVLAPGSRGLGGWTSTTGFTGTGAGMIVGQAGVYTVTLAVTNMSPVASPGSSVLQLSLGGVIYSTYIPTGGVYANLSATAALTAGAGVPMTLINNQSAASTSVDVSLTMTRVSP